MLVFDDEIASRMLSIWHITVSCEKTVFKSKLGTEVRFSWSWKRWYVRVTGRYWCTASKKRS